MERGAEATKCVASIGEQSTRHKVESSERREEREGSIDGGLFCIVVVQFVCDM